MGSEFESYTEWLIEEVRDYADWRVRETESISKEIRSLQALRSLAENMEELSADHPKVRQLWGLWFGPVQTSTPVQAYRALDLIRIVSNELQRYGCDIDDDGNPEPFLDTLIACLRRLSERDRSNTI